MFLKSNHHNPNSNLNSNSNGLGFNIVIAGIASLTILAMAFYTHQKTNNNQSAQSAQSVQSVEQNSTPNPTQNEHESDAINRATEQSDNQIQGMTAPADDDEQHETTASEPK